MNWVTQTGFAPPLVVVGVKADSGTYKMLKDAGSFALNMLGKDHKGLAFAFFKPADVSDGKISGQPYRKGDDRRAAAQRGARCRRMQGQDDRRARRPPHRDRRGHGGASKPRSWAGPMPPSSR